MTLTAQETEDAFNFIAREMGRYAQMSWDELKSQPFGDLISSLTGPDGHNRPIGKAASQRLQELAEAALRDSPFHLRVDPKVAFDSVKLGFSKQFLGPDSRSTSAAEDRELLASWIVQAGTACTTLTHYVPCHIGLKQVGPVRIGPVIFRPSADALADLEGPLQVYRLGSDEPDAKTRAELIDLSNDYLLAFSDVAEVAVADCDPTTSRRLAREAVQAALNFIHLAAGGRATKNMRGGGPLMSGVEEASVAVDQNGAAHLSWSKSWEGASIHSSFWGALKKPCQAQMVRAAGVAISTIIERTEAQMAAARYLDAAAWFADASREKSKPASIVKYLTAMERLLWTGEKGPGVTQRLSERAAALCFSRDAWNYQELVDEIRQAYGLRSGILHGRLSSADPIVLRNHRVCERAARDLLITWLDRYGEGFATPTTVLKAKTHFDAFVAEVKAETAKRASN